MANTFNITSIIQKTLLGLKALPEFQRQLRESHQPLGKLIRPFRQEDIAERHGGTGRPLWIVIGKDVFDITSKPGSKYCVKNVVALIFADAKLQDFPFRSHTQRELLRSQPGRNPMQAIIANGTIDPYQLIEDLRPHRCAILAEPRPGDGPDAFHESIYTTKEVAWHTYREVGMYTIIRDKVYDLTGESI